MLVHYAPHLPIIMAADASNDGVGAVIAHCMPDGQELPIAHALKTLFDTEKRYPQIQKEALALIFGIKKFHKYLWGRHFVLQMDHQLLVKMFGLKKGLPTTAANRLQNYAIILMAYSYDIEYVKTTAFGQADGLSRLPSGDDKDFKETAEIDAELHQLFTKQLQQAPVCCVEIAEETRKDNVLQKALLLHKKGWPDHLSSGFDKKNLLPFFKVRHELEFLNQCLLWGLRTVIPATLQKKVLNQLHQTYPGQSAMKRMARKFFWWPGLDKDIEELVSNCDACNQVRSDPTKVPLRPWPIAERPWQRVHIDFTGLFLGSMWFIAIDAHSKWPEVYEMKLQKTHAADVIVALSDMFSHWGICEDIVSDNGHQFISDEFKRFCFDNGIKNTLTPPYHPQSNGQAERFVQTFKNALLKAQAEEGKKE
uniref:RNA-directed DNA polymerase n=1 Tax=Plectus sambesii TaxID=2011161 RepID=A0A914WSH7_9BILA